MKWNVEQCVREDALEVQDIRESGTNWQETHVMHTTACASHLGKWIRRFGCAYLSGPGKE